MGQSHRNLAIDRTGTGRARQTGGAVPADAPPRALIITGPDDLRAPFARHFPAELVAELASLRPRPGSMVRYHTLLSLRELGRPLAELPGRCGVGH